MSSLKKTFELFLIYKFVCFVKYNCSPFSFQYHVALHKICTYHTALCNWYINYNAQTSSFVNVIIPVHFYYTRSNLFWDLCTYYCAILLWSRIKKELFFEITRLFSIPHSLTEQTLWHDWKIMSTIEELSNFFVKHPYTCKEVNIIQNWNEIEHYYKYYNVLYRYHWMLRLGIFRYVWKGWFNFTIPLYLSSHCTTPNK